MSRSTQYIGLNKFAAELVASAIKIEYYEMTTGMFDEPINGRIYYMPVPYPDVNESFVYKEVVQEVPWSSGPMIFTYLKEILTKKSGQVLGLDDDDGSICSWMVDPNVKPAEYDYATGRYYV